MTGKVPSQVLFAIGSFPWWQSVLDFKCRNSHKATPRRYFRSSNQTLQSQAGTGRAGWHQTPRYLRDFSQQECATLLAILPQQDAHSEATKRQILKDGYRKNISCLHTLVSLTSQCLRFISSQIKLGKCFGLHKILTAVVAFKVNYFFYAHHVA